MGASQSPPGGGRDSCLHTSKYLCTHRTIFCCLTEAKIGFFNTVGDTEFIL